MVVVVVVVVVVAPRRSRRWRPMTLWDGIMEAEEQKVEVPARPTPIKKRGGRGGRSYGQNFFPEMMLRKRHISSRGGARIKGHATWWS